MKSISALVVALVLILGLSAGTVMAIEFELSDDNVDIEHAVNEEE